MIELAAIDENIEIKTHFESTIPQTLDLTGYVMSSKMNTAGIVKQMAYQAMDSLEGWCSKQKASVLIDLVMMLNAKTIVEIGVFGGKSLVPMALAVRELNNGGLVYGIDPWSNVASSAGMDGVNKEWWSHLDHDHIMIGLISKICHLDLNDQVALIRDTSENADPIEEIDILHIDGNHSDEASFVDVTKWVPYVRKGGVIIFDDMYWSNLGIAMEWLNENCIKFAEFRGDNIWGIWIKR